MAIALDFGTCNTVIARWNEALGNVDVPFIPNLSKRYPWGEKKYATVIPSLIHYGHTGDRQVGAKVEEDGLNSHRATFKWLKLDLLRQHGANRGRRVNGEVIYPHSAAEELLSRILTFVRGHFGGADDELVVTVPVEAFDTYVDWLRDVGARHFPGGVRILDEATACILGYLKQVRDGKAYAIVDFGGGTLDVSIVRTDLKADGHAKCRLLGRAGEEIGGAIVDQWILEYVQQAEQLTDDDVADIGTPVLAAVEQAKIDLSNGKPRARIEQANHVTGKLLSHTLTSDALGKLLAHPRPPGNRSFYQLLTLTLDRALEAANTKGLGGKQGLEAVFLVGGSSRLLGVPQQVVNYFPQCKVYAGNPFEAIARGACRYAGEDFSPALVHDYCLNGWNRDLKDYKKVVVVPKGTAYPTEKPVSAKYLKAACDGAWTLGLVVYERTVMERPEITYVQGPNGLEAVQKGTQIEEKEKPLNPEDREFIQADPPCDSGERRFVAGFGVDANRRLTLSLRDLKPGNRSKIVLSDGTEIPLPIRDLPVVKL